MCIMGLKYEGVPNQVGIFFKNHKASQNCFQQKLHSIFFIKHIEWMPGKLLEPDKCKLNVVNWIKSCKYW